MVNHNNVSPLKEMKKQPAKPTCVVNGPVEIKVESWLAGSIRKNDHELQVLYSRGCIDVFVRIPSTGERFSAREYAANWKSVSSSSKKDKVLPAAKVGEDTGAPARETSSATKTTKSLDGASDGALTLFPSRGPLASLEEVVVDASASSTDPAAVKQRRMERAKVISEERRLEASQLRARRIGLTLTGQEKLPEILDSVKGVIGSITGWEEAFLSKSWKLFALDNHVSGYELSIEQRRLGRGLSDGSANVAIGLDARTPIPPPSRKAGAWKKSSHPSTLDAIAATQTPSRKGGGGTANAKSFARSK